MDIKFNPYKDIITVIGDNDSGKTTLVRELFVHKDNCFVINSSRQTSWNGVVKPENIINPTLYDTKWLDKKLLEIASKYNGKATVIMDDVDNFNIKQSKVFRTITINARHLNLGLIAISRSLSDIPKLYYKQSKYIFIATQASDYDLYYIATIIGYDNAKHLKELPKYVFAVWDRNNKKLTDIKLKL